ncbi:MAG: hypothetical protein JWM98_2625, partial [Thermoleophilia bacterium]|nr:hypothetical protein [Thermoleophilia bacterium]
HPDVEHGLLLDVFKLNNFGLVHEMKSAAKKGPVSMLMDPEFASDQPRAAMKRLGATLTEVGGFPAKNHAKGIVGTRGMVSSVPYTRFARARVEFGAVLDPASTKALRKVLRAGMTRDPGTIQAAALAAREHGILLNDPLNGVFTLRDYLDDAVKRSDSILGAVKVTDDAKSIRKLVSRAEAGAKVDLITRDISAGDVRYLRQAGAGVTEMTTLHGNAMVFGEGGRKEAYIGSAYLNERSLGRSSNRRPTRELGIVTNDPSAIAKLERTLRSFSS